MTPSDLAAHLERDVSKNWPAHAHYGVDGFGRVGSYAKAKAGHYSRGRRYWAITKWSSDCTANCRFKEEHGHDLHYPKGRVEDPSFPHFRTKGVAEAHLVEWANQHLPGGPFRFDGYSLVPAER